MKTIKKNKEDHDGLAAEFVNTPENIVIEVASEEELRRYVIPFDEWALIKEWYRDPSNTDDYYITLADSEESCRIIRLDKKSLEIRALGLSQGSVVSKNISYILFSPLHRALKFGTAFLISMTIWIMFILIALVRGAKLTHEFTQPVMKLTTVVFIVFLLLNIEAGIIKVVDIAKNKFKAFMSENETPFTDTLIFNFVLLAIFSFCKVEGIISFMKKIIDFLGV